MAIPMIRLVTLDDFYANVADPLAREFFGKMVLLRSQGYGPDYPKGYLPVDSADYVCWHHLFCIEEAGGLQPVAGFRQVPVNRCEAHRLTVPIVKTATDAHSADHERALQEIFRRHLSSGRTVVNSSALTIRKDMRADRGFAALVREWVAAVKYDDFVERHIGADVAGAILRFKTQNWFPDLGYVPLRLGGKDLPPIAKVASEGDEVLLLELEQMSEWSRVCRARHAGLFNSRIVIGNEDLARSTRAAA